MKVGSFQGYTARATDVAVWNLRVRYLESLFILGLKNLIIIRS